MKLKFNIQDYGTQALLISFAPIIDREQSQIIIQLNEYLKKYFTNKLLDTSFGYHSLLLYFKEAVIEKRKLLEKAIAKFEYSEEGINQKTWEIPVCYHFDLAMDLTVFLKRKDIGLEELIKLHTQSVYFVYCKGFLPGFLYLGGLNSDLWLDRKKIPSPRIPRNSIAIGGQQTGIYPSETPGGWHVIGKTPLDFFNIHNTEKIKPGDLIKFHSISIEEYQKMEVLKYRY